jgi:hypothetical protein
VHKPQLDFFTFCSLFLMVWQRLLYHRIIFRPLRPRMAGFLKLKGNWLRSVWHALRCRRILGRIPERVPVARNPVIENGSLDSNKLEQVLTGKVCQCFWGLL